MFNLTPENPNMFDVTEKILHFDQGNTEVDESTNMTADMLIVSNQ